MKSGRLLRQAPASRELTELVPLLDLLEFLLRTRAHSEGRAEIGSRSEDFPFEGARLVIERCRQVIAGASSGDSAADAVIDDVFEPCADILKSTANE
jgi:hypothetical protein